MLKTQQITDPQNRVFKYRTIKDARYKYQITKEYWVQINIHPMAPMNHVFYGLEPNGLLCIKVGYRWDGASGPTIDTKNTMRASCIHDIFYQMMRERQIRLEHKDAADLELKRIMLEDGNPKTFFGRCWNVMRGSYYYYGVKFFGASSCKPK